MKTELTASPDSLPAAVSPTGAPAVAAAAQRQPYITLRPQSGWVPLNIRELWLGRDLLLTLAMRDLKLRYKQTALGVLWVVFQPLLAAGIFSFVFGKVAKLPSDGVPYILFSFAGLLGWNLFNNTVSKCSTSLISNAQLISKAFFPRLLLPLSTVLSVLVDFSVAAGLMAVLLATHGVWPGWEILLLPIFMLMVLLFSTGLGLGAAALAVEYRDIPHTIPVILQILLYASPIAYSVSAVPEHLRSVYLLNPLSAPLEAFRASLLHTQWPSAGSLVYASVVATLVFLGGLFAFRRMEKRFADII